MNQDQTLGLVRALLTAVGSILATKGLIDSSAVSTDVSIFMTAIGGVMAAGSLAWNLYSKTKRSTIAAAAKLPNVQTIVTDQKTADALPSAKVVGPTG